MSKTIKHEVFFQYPPEIIWKFLTDPTLLSQWLMENNFQPVVGHKFQFKSKAKVNVGYDGNVYCEVLEVVPNKKLSYSWKGGPGKGKITLDSVVTWTLLPESGGTKLILEHTGFKAIKNYIAFLVMGKGWSLIIRKKLSGKLSLYYYETKS